jgi:hypothetical protein
MAKSPARDEIIKGGFIIVEKVLVDFLMWAPEHSANFVYH